MYSAIAITLIFVGCTSALGMVKNIAAARRSGRVSQIAGGTIAALVAVWCWYCAAWLFNQ